MVTPAEAVEAARVEFQQVAKNQWTEDRNDCLNYYNGLTEEYTRKKFSSKSLAQVVVANNNITRRVTDRVSLVNMVKPIRTLTSANDNPHPQQDYYSAITAAKDVKLPRAERYTNLLRLVALGVFWDDKLQRFEYQVITDFEPEFVASSPFSPVAINYPISTISNVRDTTPETWRRWDLFGWQDYQQGEGSQLTTAGDDLDYGVLPFVFCFADGAPETEFLDVPPALDLMATNHSINVALTNKNANMHFQSFGQPYATGIHDDRKIPWGPDVIPMLPEGATMGILSPPDTLQSITASVQSDYKAIAQNYGLDPSFVEGTTAQSGVALRIRNQELTDNRKADVEVWRDIESQIYAIEKAILSYHQPAKGRALPDTMSVDFSESTDVLSPQEQREKDEWDLAHGLTTEAAIAVRRNPDRFEDEAAAEEWVKANKAQNRSRGGGLLDALSKPVEE